MKKLLLISLAAILPATTMAVEEDSVYAWGAWAEGIQPAAGPVARVTPQPAEQPKVNFRPNENSALSRGIVRVEVPAVAPVTPTPARVPVIDQPNVVTTTVNTPATATSVGEAASITSFTL